MAGSDWQVQRVLAHLMRNEGVPPSAIERAVQSACDMRLGESVSLEGDDAAPMRRAFVQEQIVRLERAR